MTELKALSIYTPLAKQQDFSWPRDPISSAHRSDAKPAESESNAKSLRAIEARQQPSLQATLPGRESDPAMQVFFGTLATPPQGPGPRFDAGSLYDASGIPQDRDICQDAIGDCYFVSTLAAIADKQPRRIQDAIQYDEKTQTFHVRLYKPVPGFFGGLEGKPVKIPVTQKEIEYNLERKGGSTVDNNPEGKGPLWPAVIETAFAKLYDKDWSDGLKQGFDRISGGFPSMAMFTLTGDTGKLLILHAPPNQFGLPNPVTEEMVSRGAYEAMSKSLAQDRPVTLAARKEFNDLLEPFLGKLPQDGLRDFHVYQVKDTYQNSKGELFVRLRNPWGDNKKVDEGRNSSDPMIDVKIKTIVSLGMLGAASINIGPGVK